MNYLDSEILKSLMREEFVKREVVIESVDHVIGNLIQTSLRGVDSHGIHLFPHYIRAVESGRINKCPKMKINKTSDGTAVLDADHGFGHHAGAKAINLAIEYSKKSGIAAVNVKNSTHFAAAAYYGIMAAESNCIGFAFTNADALLRSARSAEPFFGTNPICFSAPLKNEDPFCLDMATSIVSFNKIKDHSLAGESIPNDWATTEDGSPTTNPSEAKVLNPIGDYKGYGLAMMVDILCAVITASPIGKDILPMFTSLIESKRYISHFFMVLDISKFVKIDDFKDALQSMVDRARKQRPLASDKPVLVPGDPEKITYKKRIVDGIPINDENIQNFYEISKEFKLTIL